VLKIADGVEMLQLQVESFGVRSELNPTLIWDEKNAILIDTGLPGYWNALQQALQEAGVPHEKLTAIIVTHQDLDHIGSLPQAVNGPTGRVKVYAHELERSYVEGKLPLIKTTPAAMAPLLNQLPEEMRRRALAVFEHPPRADVDETLDDGQELPFCGGIRVVHTPGHTAGHLSLYLQRSKILIAGDALICEDGVLQEPVRATLDMEEAMRSVSKLAELDIEAIVCYHGGLCAVNAGEQLRKLAANRT
jgi:glyoxylase-like metal-dependent hydrolase (beta-lactamase superfamily II)